MDFRSFLKTKTATWLLAVALAFVMLFTAKTLVQQYRVNKQITKLQEQADKIKKDNEQLSYLIQYFNTKEYQEKQAREKLNLKKDGEFVVSLPADNEAGDKSVSETKRSNSSKWFDYFFKQQ